MRRGKLRHGVAYAAILLMAAALAACHPQPENTAEPVVKHPSAGWATYQDVTQLFRLEYPADWIVRQTPQEDGFRVTFTPIRDTSIPVADLPCAASVFIFFTPEGNPDAYMPQEDVFERWARIYVAQNAEYGCVYERKEKIFHPGLKSEVVRGYFHGASRGVEFNERLIRLARPRWTLDLICDAPAGDTDRAAALERLEMSLRAPESIALGLDTPEDAPVPDRAELVKRIRECAVLLAVRDGNGEIMGTGSGFFIHPAGYILTNAHVLSLHEKTDTDPANLKIEVYWDRRLQRPSAPAEYVAHYYRESRNEYQTMDWAIVRVDMAGCPYLAPSSMAGIDNLTEVITASFPKPDMEENEFDITFSTGHALRLRHSFGGRLESIVSSANVEHGSSGSSCVNARTGRVIGVNTTASREKFFAYAGVQPIERAYERFEVMYFPPEGPGGLTAQDHFKLAAMFYGRKCYEAAERELATACQIDRMNPHAWALRGNLAWAQGDTEKAAEYLQKALRFDAAHPGALHSMASLAYHRGAWAEALGYADRYVQAHPQLPNGYHLRADLRLAAEGKSYEEILADIEKATALSHDLFPDSYLLQARLFKERGQPGDAERARAAIEKALAIHPYHFEALREFARMESRAPVKIERFVRLAKTYPNRPEILWLAGNALAERESDAPLALRNYQRAFDLFSAREEPAPLEFFREAGAFAIAQSPALALRLHLQMYYTTPDEPRINAESLLGIARSLYALPGRRDLARAFYRMARKQDRAFVESRMREDFAEIRFEEAGSLTEESAMFSIARIGPPLTARAMACVDWEFSAEECPGLRNFIAEKDFSADEFFASALLLKLLAGFEREEAGGELRPGDLVQVTANLREMVEKSPILLWRAPMQALAGQRCVVAETDTDGTVKIWTPDKSSSWWVPVTAVERIGAEAPGGEELRPGDIVIVSEDLKRYVDDFPFLSWMEGMRALAGKPCEVAETDTDGTVRVHSPDKSSVWWIPVEAVSKAGGAPGPGRDLRPGDLVDVSPDVRRHVEESPILTWKEPMEALPGSRCEVKETDTDGTVKIYTPDKSSSWWVPVASVKKAAGGGPPPADFQPGDLVQISNDLERECKESRAGWVSDMSGMVGQVCEVKEVDTDGTIQVWTPDKSAAWWVPVTSARKVDGASELKPGDRVLLSENLKNECEEDDAGWVDAMEVMVGKVCEIKRIRDDGRLEVYLPDKSDYWIIPRHSARPVAPPSPAAPSALRAGECALVSAELKALTFELFPELWVDSMENLAGQVCEVQTVDTDGTICVFTPDKSASYWIPEKAATPADCAPAAPAPEASPAPGVTPEAAAPPTE